MLRLLIFAGLALTAQSLSLAPEPAESTTAHPSLSADLIKQHVLMGWSLPQSSGSGPRPSREAQAATTEATTTAHPSLSAELINQHMLMGWSLPQPGPGPRPTREALAASSEAPAADPSLFSADLLKKHTLMGWSLPQPGPGARPTRDAPAIATEAAIAAEATTAHPSLGAEVQKSSSLSSGHLLEHTRMGQPTPGAPRPIRAAPRALPAHKAHGPRAFLPNGPYATRQNDRVKLNFEVSASSTIKPSSDQASILV